MTFVLHILGGGPESGYVSTGFFGGKCLVSHCFLVLNVIGLTLGTVVYVGDREGNGINNYIIFNNSRQT